MNTSFGYVPGLYHTGFALLLATLFGLSGCAEVKTTNSGTIGVERKQSMLMLVSSEDAFSMGEQSYVALINQAAAKGQLNTDPAMTKRVRLIADKLIPHVSVFRDDALGWPWEVHVVIDDQVANAFCTGRGKIVFYTGIIKQLKLTDDEIAAVMGHEIAHALREHGRERISNQMGASFAVAGVSAVAKLDQQKSQMAEQLSAVLFTLPHSRIHEQESDRIGLELMVRAGYNPNAAPQVWKKMQQKFGEGGPLFLNTHPSHESRMQDLQQLVPVVMPHYQATLKAQKKEADNKTPKNSNSKKKSTKNN